MSDTKLDVEMAEAEVWVLVDENGDIVASHDGDQLSEIYDNEIGQDSDVARRIVKIKIRVPKPRAVEATVTVPPEPEGVAAEVA